MSAYILCLVDIIILSIRNGNVNIRAVKKSVAYIRFQSVEYDTLACTVNVLHTDCHVFNRMAPVPSTWPLPMVNWKW